MTFYFHELCSHWIPARGDHDMASWFPLMRFCKSDDNNWQTNQMISICSHCLSQWSTDDGRLFAKVHFQIVLYISKWNALYCARELGNTIFKRIGVGEKSPRTLMVRSVSESTMGIGQAMQKLCSPDTSKWNVRTDVLPQEYQVIQIVKVRSQRKQLLHSLFLRSRNMKTQQKKWLSFNAGFRMVKQWFCLKCSKLFC